MSTCIIQDCERSIHNKTHGWCERHYRQWYTHGDPLVNKKVKHGLGDKPWRIPEYGAWAAMKDRCRRKNHRQYAYYGGRGITVCDRWLKSYSNFLDDMGKRPSSDYSLDRINNSGNYEPGNCRWATRSEQNKNRRDFSPEWYRKQHLPRGPRRRVKI